MQQEFHFARQDAAASQNLFFDVFPDGSIIIKLLQVMRDAAENGIIRQLRLQGTMREKSTGFSEGKRLQAIDASSTSIQGILFSEQIPLDKADRAAAENQHDMFSLQHMVPEIL